MKVNKKYLFLIFVPLFICVMIYRCMYITIDSDYSNLVLEANDILNGNFFLNDWNQTGISFITTDLLFFVFGVIFGGVSELSYYIAIGVMISFVVILGLLLCEPSRRENVDIVLYLLLCSIPGTFATMSLRAHTGAICYVFLCLLLVNEEMKKHNKWNLIFIFVAFTMGCIGDAVTLIVGVLPLLLYCFAVFVSKEKDNNQIKKCKWLTLVTIASVVCSVILDKLYYLIGGANKNDFLGDRTFEDLENWGSKFVMFLKAVFMIEDAYFFGDTLISVTLLCYIVNTLIVLIGFLLTFKSIWDFLKGKDKDIISTFLSIGVVIISLIFVITDIAVAVGSARYIAYFLMVFSILIVRNRKWLCNCTRVNSSAVMIGLLLMATASFGYRVVEVYQDERTSVEQKELGDFLEDNGLKNGYGGFWNASSTTVSSENRVTVRAVIDTGGEQYRFKMYDWFCKNSWYDEEANFVVATEEDAFGITPENVISCWGEPIEILEYKEWKILVYDKDLSQDVGK